MEEDHSIEFGREINNHRWKDGRYVNKPGPPENYKGEGYEFYGNILENQQPQQKLKKLRRNPVFLNVVTIDHEKYTAVYVLSKGIDKISK